MSHPGIELRVSVPAGTILQANSDLLHYQSKMQAGTDWRPLVGELLDANGLKIEIRAVELAPFPSDEEQCGATFCEVTPTDFECELPAGHEPENQHEASFVWGT